jgi:hypothetical protein
MKASESTRLLNQSDVDYFLHRIKKNFPNFVAGVITDRNGFPIGANISKRLWVHENTLALSAVAKNRDFLIKDPNLIQLKLNIDRDKQFKLFLLLEKSKHYKSRLKSLKAIIKTQQLF